MTLTQAGIDYICQNFGDTNLCCVSSGLSWTYIVPGAPPFPETGGTAQIVGRLASGIIESLTMTYPDRGTFTQAELNAANGGTVTIQDAQIIATHDEPSEDQWCYFIPQDCTNPTGTHGTKFCGYQYPSQFPNPDNEYECVDGTWIDNGWTSECDLQEACTNPAGTHNSTYCYPTYGQPPYELFKCADGQWISQGQNKTECGYIFEEEFPWMWIAIGAGFIAVAVASAYVVAKKR